MDLSYLQPGTETKPTLVFKAPPHGVRIIKLALQISYYWAVSSILASLVWFYGISTIVAYSYLPTPPLGQDMTQDQFLSGV